MEKKARESCPSHYWATQKWDPHQWALSSVTLYSKLTRVGFDFVLLRELQSGLKISFCWSWYIASELAVMVSDLDTYFNLPLGGSFPWSDYLLVILLGKNLNRMISLNLGLQEKPKGLLQKQNLWIHDIIQNVKNIYLLPIFKNWIYMFINVHVLGWWHICICIYTGWCIFVSMSTITTF